MERLLINPLDQLTQIAVEAYRAAGITNFNSENTMTKTTERFTIGQTLVFQPKDPSETSAKPGTLCTVGPRGYYTTRYGSRYIDIVWDRKVTTQNNGGYYIESFKAHIEKPKEPSAPMTRAVLDLMRRKGALTSMEAQGVLRCRQLPARVLELKRLGHKIVTELKFDPTGQKYARYHLMAA